MITPAQTTDGQPMQIVSCDGDGCNVAIHALGAPAVARAEVILRPEGEHHYCPGCSVRRGPGLVQIPHPEHR